MTSPKVTAILQKIEKYLDVSKYDENHLNHVLYWFLGSMGVCLVLCIFFDRSFVTTNEHGLYLDRSGSIATKACNVYKVKVWMYLHWPFYIKKNSSKLDEDYLAEPNANKYQIFRTAINNEVTKFFNPSSPLSPYSTSKVQELEDYKSKIDNVTGVPHEYLSPNYVMNTFLKFLPHENYHEVQQLAKKLNSNECDVDLEKNQYLEEECGICLDSIYLPKNDSTDKYEAKCSSIKLMCGHKFHFSCFIKNTYRTWGSEKMILSESGVEFDESINERHPVNIDSAFSNESENEEEEEVAPTTEASIALQNHRDELRKKLLENIQRQHQSIPEITEPVRNNNLRNNEPHVAIHSRSAETFIGEEDDDVMSVVGRPLRNNFNNTSSSVEYIDDLTVEEHLMIEKTLSSRVDRKCHCALCRLDVELVVAYLNSKKMKVKNCQVV